MTDPQPTERQSTGQGTPEGHTPEGPTPEGHTPEGPSPDELGKLGTPGAGMTPAVPHPADAGLVEHGAEPADAVAHHDAVTHIDAHTALSDDDHGHAEPVIGPVDWTAWAYAAVGVAAGLLVVALFWVAAA